MPVCLFDFSELLKVGCFLGTLLAVRFETLSSTGRIVALGEGWCFAILGETLESRGMDENCVVVVVSVTLVGPNTLSVGLFIKL